MQSKYANVMGHEIHFTEWGKSDAPALIMWHGLARTGRDFDLAAARYAESCRVICPDTIGRGLSGWSKNPDQDYTVPAYCAHALGLMDALGIQTCKWVGTSMGGLIGMALAGSDLGKDRISALVVNDIGPVLNPEAVQRIKDYVGIVPEFDTMAQFEAFLRLVYAPFGITDDAEWRQMAETSMRRRENGKISSHFDPAVMRVFCEQFTDFDAWDLWDAITCPTLVLRGENSDLLLAETAEEMTRRGPKAHSHTIPGCGHAPALNRPDQWSILDILLNSQ